MRHSHPLKLAALITLLFSFSTPLHSTAQNIKRQTDKHIINQQERMVFKSWDRKKFTPKKGFLGLNYQYWLTWAWHPNYPKTDRRPLRPGGPQTLRMGLVLAMQQTEKSYKLQSDTIKKNAVSEAASRAGLLSSTDPLWKLYYGRMFSDLLDSMAKDPLAGLEQPVKIRLKQLRSLEWYTEQRAELKERLDGMRAADIERGNRILGYHHLLVEYRKLLSQWKRKIAHTKKYLKIMEGWDISRGKPTDHPVFTVPKTDIEIADEILKNNQ